MDLTEILLQFEKRSIIVVGDYMADVANYGKVERLIPGFPFPVVNIERTTYSLGGAGNTAKNISVLGSTVYVVGFIGGNGNRIEDYDGKQISDEFKKQNIIATGIFIDNSRPTTKKITTYGRGESGPYYPLLRTDDEKTHENSKIEKEMIDYIGAILSSVDAVVISDYAKGVVTGNLVSKIKDLCKKENIVLVIDPKPPRSENFYKGATLITPNLREASEMTSIKYKPGNLKLIGEELREKLGSNILLTRGEEGMSLFQLDGNLIHIPAIAEEVYDVTGAGDTVAGLATAALASGANLEQAAILTNYAASIVVGKLGTATATIGEIQKVLEQYKLKKEQIRPDEFQYRFTNNNKT